MHQKSFTQIKKNLKKDFSDFKSMKLAILGDSSTQFLNIAIRGLSYDYGMNLDIWEADYDQIPMQVYDTNSDLYIFKPDLILIYKSSHKLLQEYNTNNKDQLISFGDEHINEIKKFILLFLKILTQKLFFITTTKLTISSMATMQIRLNLLLYFN